MGGSKTHCPRGILRQEREGGFLSPFGRGVTSGTCLCTPGHGTFRGATTDALEMNSVGVATGYCWALSPTGVTSVPFLRPWWKALLVGALGREKLLLVALGPYSAHWAPVLL